MKVGKISKRDIKYITEFITKIYEDYKVEYNTYIARAVKAEGNKLDHILDFINTWSRNVMDIANEYDVVRNIITNSSDISVHKDGRYTIVLETIDCIENVINCTEFGSIFSIYKETEIVCAGVLRFSYITQLICTIDGTTKLYNYDDKTGFNFVSNVISPKEGERYFITDGKNICYNDYQVYQFVDKLKPTHNLIYSKSLVQNFFHIVTNGGVFLSTAEETGTTHIKSFFQAIPLSFIGENCGISCYSDDGVKTFSLNYPQTKREMKGTAKLVMGSVGEMKKYTDIINPSLVFFD